MAIIRDSQAPIRMYAPFVGGKEVKIVGWRFPDGGNTVICKIDDHQQQVCDISQLRSATNEELITLFGTTEAYEIATEIKRRKNNLAPLERIWMRVGEGAPLERTPVCYSEKGDF